MIFIYHAINTLIEVDGIGHFEVTRFNGMAVDEAIINYEETLKRDKIKNIYCINNNIPLIRIDYKDIDNLKYKEILNNILNH